LSAEAAALQQRRAVLKAQNKELAKQQKLLQKRRQRLMQAFSSFVCCFEFLGLAAGSAAAESR